MARATYFASIVIVAVSACKPRQAVESSRAQDLNQGAMMNGENDTLERMKKGKRVVVIFYANDTYSLISSDPAQQNFWALRDLLRDAAGKDSVDAAAKATLLKVADRIQTDWDTFNDSIGQDVSALVEKLCSNISQDYRESVGGLVVFRNQVNQANASAVGTDTVAKLERSLRFEFCKPGDAYTSSNIIRVPRDDSFPYLSQPFSHPLIFERSLEAVRQEFPGASHRYILITKSHGSSDYAISPHLSVDMREMIKQDGAKIVAAITRANISDDLGLDADKFGDPILADVDASIKRDLANPPRGFPGVSKRDYVNILNRLGGGNDAMHFPIVLMQSCKSDLNLASDARLKPFLKPVPGGATDQLNYSGFKMPNVGLLYTSDERGLGYDTINYWALSSMEFNGYADFQDLFKTFLDGIAAPRDGASSL